MSFSSPSAPVEFRELSQYPSLLVFRDGRVLWKSTMREVRTKEIKPERKPGYFQFFCRNILTGRKDTLYVHRVVALAFCRPPAGARLEECEVHHVNSVPHDNRAENLQFLPVRAHRRADRDLRELERRRGLALGELAARARAAGAAADHDAAKARRRVNRKLIERDGGEFDGHPPRRIRSTFPRTTRFCCLPTIPISSNGGAYRDCDCATP